jgi:hypothetical protein
LIPISSALVQFDEAPTFLKHKIYSVKPVDIDRDGDIDILCKTEGGICWLENNGKGEFIAKNTIRHCYRRCWVHFDHAIDIDKDGKLDLIGTNILSFIQWAKGLGNGLFDEKESLVSAKGSIIGYGDLDRDGYVYLILKSPDCTTPQSSNNRFAKLS